MNLELGTRNQAKEAVMGDALSLSRVDGVVRKSLTGLTMRQRAIAQNVANVDTPGYKASDVRFEDALSAELAGSSDEVTMQLTDPRHMDPDAPRRLARVVTPNTKMRADGNSVDLDEEMIKLSEVQLTFEALAQIATSRGALLRTLVNDGRR